VSSTTGMEGLTEVGVFVHVDTEMQSALSLRSSEVKTQVELYLRKVPGLAVTDSIAGPIVSVGVEGLLGKHKDGSVAGFFSGHVIVELTQPALIARPPRVLSLDDASTWQSIRHGHGPAGSRGRNDVRDMVNRLLDEFQNEYLKANPEVKPQAP